MYSKVLNDDILEAWHENQQSINQPLSPILDINSLYNESYRVNI